MVRWCRKRIPKASVSLIFQGKKEGGSKESTKKGQKSEAVRKTRSKKRLPDRLGVFPAKRAPRGKIMTHLERGSSVGS